MGGGAGQRRHAPARVRARPRVGRRQRRGRRRREGQGARPAGARDGRPPAARRASQAPEVTTAATGSDAPAWLAPLIVIAGLLAALFAFLRLRGASPEGVIRPLRASFADAGGRTADAVAQIWDSVRLGR